MLIDFRTLFPKYRIKPKGVLHLGANQGEEAPIYHQLGIKKVIWVEANPEIFLQLKSNISKYSGQTAFNFCVGDENKETVLHVANNGGQSSSVLELGTHRAQHPNVHYIKDVRVQMTRVDTMMLESSMEGIDFLNADLQGFEFQALKGMGDLIKQIKWAYLEVNKADVYQGCAQIETIDLFMIGHGLTRVETKWVGNWGDALYIRRELL